MNMDISHELDSQEIKVEQPIQDTDMKSSDPVPASVSMAEEEINHTTGIIEDKNSEPASTDRRQKDLMDRIDKFNKEFIENKERVFADKMAAYHKEIRDIREGVSASFQNRLAMLETEKDEILFQAEVFRDYQLEFANIMYDAEVESCMETYQNEKDNLRSKLMAVLEERKRKLKEEFDNFDINNETLFEAQKNVNTRKTTRFHLSRNSIDDRKEKRRKTAGASLAFLLKDHEALDDLNTLRRANYNSKKSSQKPFSRR